MPPRTYYKEAVLELGSVKSSRGPMLHGQDKFNTGYEQVDVGLELPLQDCQ